MEKIIKLDEFTTEYWNNGKKFKSVYQKDNYEKIIYFTGKGRRETIKQIVETFIENSNKTVVNQYYNVGIKYLVITENGKTKISHYYNKQQQLIKSIEQICNDKTSFKMCVFEYSINKNTETIIYEGSFLKDGIGKKIIEYDKFGNVLSEINNINYYNSVLSQNQKFNATKINCENSGLLLKYVSNSSFTIDEIKSILIQSKTLTLNGECIMNGVYEYNTIYDLPLKFASAVYNSKTKYLCLNKPEMFTNIDNDKIYAFFDKLSIFARGYKKVLPINSLIKANIDNYNFDLIAIGNGDEGNCFKVCSDKYKPIILKIYHAESNHSVSGITFAPSGLYGNLGVLYEANLRKISDVPMLFMANPTFKPIMNNGVFSYIGGWQLCEDANTMQKLNDGVLFQDWIKSKGLVWLDDKPRHSINSVNIDLGYVTVGGNKSNMNGGRGDDLVNYIYSRYLNGETTDEILKFLYNIQ